MQKSELFNEEKLIEFIVKGELWQNEFVREFLKNNPEKMDQWSNFRKQFINILETFDSPIDIFTQQKKEVALKIIIDLERKDMIKYCLDNFKQIESEELRKLALFALINFGNEDLLLELKSFIKPDNKLTEFVVDFWKKLERHEYKFYY